MNAVTVDDAAELDALRLKVAATLDRLDQAVAKLSTSTRPPTSGRPSTRAARLRRRPRFAR